MRVSDIRKTAEERGGKFLKFEEGDTKIRLVSEMEIVYKVFHGNTVESFKHRENATETAKVSPPDRSGKPARVTDRLVVWVINRTNGQIQLAELPASVGYAIADLDAKAGYEFDRDIPPYDIVVTADDSEPIRKYTILPSRENTPLTDIEKAEIAKLEDIKSVAFKECVDKDQLVIDDGDMQIEKPMEIPSRSDLEDKEEIVRLIKNKFKANPKSKEEYDDFVKSKTGYELVPANYKSIIKLLNEIMLPSDLADIPF